MKKLILNDYNENDIFWKDFKKLPNSPYIVDGLKDFRCLFVFPTKAGDLSRDYYANPLGTMASLLRMNNAKADIKVYEDQKYDPQDFNGYDLIGIYPMISSFPHIMNLPKKIKEDYPNSKVCFFNSDQHQHEMMLCTPQAKIFSESLMQKYDSLDYVLIGEAESSFLKLCKKIKNKESDFEEIPFCLYRHPEGIKISNKPMESVDFRFLPFSSRDHLEETVSSEGINLLSPRVQSSRGCTSRCSFCVESAKNIIVDGRKTPVISRDISKFVDELELLQKNYGVIFFNVIDSSFEDPGEFGIKRMERFADEVLERKIEGSFKIHLRTETIDKLSDSYLDKLKMAGVDIIGAGVESALEKELREYSKRTTIDKSVRAVTRLENQNKFFAVVGYIMFTPELKPEDFLKKVDFLKKINRGWDYMNLAHSLLIFPGTGYHDHIKSIGLEKEHDKLAPLIPYNFVSEEIKNIAQEVSNLKIRCPELIILNNKVYDAMNIISRYSNKMNESLWQEENSFNKFKSDLMNILKQTSERYEKYMPELAELICSKKFEEKRLNLLFEKYIPNFFPQTLRDTEGLTSEFINHLESKGLSTNKLYLKTWLSIRDTNENIAGGKK
jgi:radical SAM superfamily enzyme YgiQ (UPF0313 family)